LVAGVAGVAAIPIVGDPAVFEASLATRGQEEQTAATRALIATVLRLAG
jgi:hypothetical protein